MPRSSRKRCGEHKFTPTFQSQARPTDTRTDATEASHELISEEEPQQPQSEKAHPSVEVNSSAPFPPHACEPHLVESIISRAAPTAPAARSPAPLPPPSRLRLAAADPPSRGHPLILIPVALPPPRRRRWGRRRRVAVGLLFGVRVLVPLVTGRCPLIVAPGVPVFGQFWPVEPTERGGRSGGESGWDVRRCYAKNTANCLCAQARWLDSEIWTCQDALGFGGAASRGMLPSET